MGYEDDPLQSSVSGFWLLVECVIAVGVIVLLLAIAGVL